MVLAGPLQGHGLSNSPPPNLNAASQVHLKSKCHVTPHRGHFQDLSPHGKWREMCRVALVVPAPGWRPQSPMVIPSTALGPAGPRGSRDTGKTREGRGGPWEEAWYVHACHEEDRTRRISAARQDPGDRTGAGRWLSRCKLPLPLGSPGEKQSWNLPGETSHSRAAALTPDCRPRARSCPCVHQHKSGDAKPMCRGLACKGHIVCLCIL